MLAKDVVSQLCSAFSTISHKNAKICPVMFYAALKYQKIVCFFLYVLFAKPDVPENGNM